MDIHPATPIHATPRTSASRQRRRGRTAAALTAAAALVATMGACTADSDADAGSATTAVESRMTSLVDPGYPAALASVTAPGGTSSDVAVGTGDIDSGAEPPLDGEVRIASNTKMYVATIVMQLVEEGLVALDEPIETYLPGLVEGQGIDGATITVRQLLQHTAGLPEYVDQVAADAFGAQNDYTSPRDMLDLALAKPAVFAPGAQWQYSNTNYLVLGLLVERVTKRSLVDQLHDRIAEPLGLKHTYLPKAGERTIRGKHPHGYHVDGDRTLKDIATLDPSFAWSAGGVIASPSDVNRFMQALLGGKLVEKASLAEMQRAVPAGDELTPESTYGLGLQSYPLSCGGVAWGHGGDIPGTQTRNAVGPDGTAVTIAVTALPWAIEDPADDERLTEKYRIVVDALDETLCDS